MPTELATRTPHRLYPDARRVITKEFFPGEETPNSRSRVSAVISRVLAMNETDVERLADAVVADYHTRHHDLIQTFTEHFAAVAHDIPGNPQLSAARRLLIGACFTHEYSPEAAALFNPSIAPHPDQSGLTDGQLRFVMTVRCVGEGHLSSIGFRTGILGPSDAIHVDEPDPLLTTGRNQRATYHRRLFLNALADLGDDAEETRLLLGELPETFTASELDDTLTGIVAHRLARARTQRTIDHVRRLAAATYDVEFAPQTRLTQRLLWPVASAESHGMEDARLVRFTDNTGTVTYFATYTAYDGARVAPHLLETRDFAHFAVSPMAGRAAQNKGLALFPRPIGSRYVALSRWDRENTTIVDSDDLRIWNEPTTLHVPRHGWEIVQVGNCGSPIETPNGWLVLTHGVGPMRAYAIGALLLDLDDPSTVVATLPEPLLTPRADERDGLVPNVVYSCGALLHDGVVTIPYGISDGAIGFAQVRLSELLGRMS